MKQAAGMGPSAAFFYQEQGCFAWLSEIASWQIHSGASLSCACSISFYPALWSTLSFDGANLCSHLHRHELGILLHLSGHLGGLLMENVSW